MQCFPETNMKQCYKCKVEKPLSEFHKSKAHSLGVCPECKSCCNNRKREKYKENLGEKEIT